MEKSQTITINSASEVFKYLKHIGRKKNEYIYGLYLNKNNILLHKQILSKGSRSKTSVRIWDIFYPALIHKAESIILAHNHPSDEPAPSKEDINFTAQVKKAAFILQISFLDHVIISKNAYFSFYDEKKALEVAFKAFLC